MLTVIKARGKLEVARTDNPIPLKEDGSVNYEEYVNRIKRNYRTVARDLTKVF